MSSRPRHHVSPARRGVVYAAMTGTDRSAARYDGALAATLSGVLDRIRNRGAALPLTDSDRLDGSTCLVTGANRGLGLAIARELAKRGAGLILACRSGLDGAVRDVGSLARRPTDVSGAELDLGDLDSVERCVEDLERRGVRARVVILNAGVVPREARKTRDGFDESFQVNFLADYLFARRLLERGLVASDDSAHLPRLVLVSSESHRSAPPIDLAKLGIFEPWGMRQAVEQYGYGKLLLQTFTSELARRTRGVVAVHSLCPGAVRTDIGREAPRWVKPALDLTMRAFFQAPETASLPAVYLACSRAIEGETDVYLHTTRRRAVSAAASDPVLGRQVWERAESLLATRGHSLRAEPPTPSDSKGT